MMVWRDDLDLVRMKSNCFLFFGSPPRPKYSITFTYNKPNTTKNAIKNVSSNSSKSGKVDHFLLLIFISKHFIFSLLLKKMSKVNVFSNLGASASAVSTLPL